MSGQAAKTRAAIYARVSTFDQDPENQLRELRAYAQARGWDAKEFVDRGVSGSKDSRPALDLMVKEAKRKKVGVIVVWRLDRLGRSLAHLVSLVDELNAVGVGLVSLGEALDTTTPSGRLILHVMGSLAEFERERIIERVRAGMARAKAQGKRMGRPCNEVSSEDLHRVAHLSVRDAAEELGVSKSLVGKLRLSTKAA